MADEPDEAEVVFAFSPALAVQGLLDFTKGEHSKIYKSAIREVSKEPFDCKAEGLFQFLKDVQDRADEMKWSDGILNITLEVTDDNEPVHTCSTSASWRPWRMLQRRESPYGQTSTGSATMTCAAAWLSWRSSSERATLTPTQPPTRFVRSYRTWTVTYSRWTATSASSTSMWNFCSNHWRQGIRRRQTSSSTCSRDMELWVTKSFERGSCASKTTTRKERSSHLTTWW